MATLLTATVVPGTVPASTGIQVAADLSTVGGSSTQTFYDDGTNGDVTAGDNVFSYSFDSDGGWELHAAGDGDGCAAAHGDGFDCADRERLRRRS